MSIEAVPIGDIRPSTYNPRRSDESRLNLVALSLEKLGFVLPIVADSSGEIISGHQRHLVAGRLGFDKVPVHWLPSMDEATRKGLNIVFNRGTNDMAVTDHSKDMSVSLAHSEVIKLSDTFPDAEDRFRCMTGEVVDLRTLADQNRAQYNPHMKNMARALSARAHMQMPIVATRAGKIVNGIGRLQYGMERKKFMWPVVWVEEAEAAFAGSMLNLLSMDFEIEKKYADVLRHNSFRRSRSTRTNLGTGFTFALKPRPQRTKDFDLGAVGSKDRWVKKYGSSIVDFGAGHGHETEMLQGIGVHVAHFEPYKITNGDNVDPKAGRKSAADFLDEIEAGTQYSSVFISSVLNSVPFREDRMHMICICAALCGPVSRLYTNPMATSHPNWKEVKFGLSASKRRQDTATFKLDYESGVVLGDFMQKPKVQKYHEPKEIYEMLKEFFEKVSVEVVGAFLACTCINAKPIKPKRLRDALKFEFDLPYPDGTRMGLADRAIEAFEKRLGVTL